MGKIFRIALLLACMACMPAFPIGKVMIWPVNPVIESTDSATPLWLENQGAEPVTLQIRVLGWRAENYSDSYDENQDEVLASPPMATIEPGKRQLVRLTKISEVEPGLEKAYRVLIDEIPAPPGPAKETATTLNTAVQMRMRYSLPLFIYGKGLWERADSAKKHDTPRGEPKLGWRIVDEKGSRFLEVRNMGSVHARLTAVSLFNKGRTLDVAAGLLGYVLPGADMRWPLADTNLSLVGLELRAFVNGTKSDTIGLYLPGDLQYARLEPADQ